MVQKEVEDIFEKTMQKEAFKRASTIKLAKNFIRLSKNQRQMLKQTTKITEE